MLCTRQVILLRWPPPPPPNNKTCPWVSFNKTLSRWRHPAQPSFYFISHSNQYWNVELFARKKNINLAIYFVWGAIRFLYLILQNKLSKEAAEKLDNFKREERTFSDCFEDIYLHSPTPSPHPIQDQTRGLQMFVKSLPKKSSPCLRHD